MTRRLLLVVLAALVACMVALVDTGPGQSSNTAVAGCKGHVAVIELPRSRYPNIAAHIEDSWALGAELRGLPNGTCVRYDFGRVE